MTTEDDIPLNKRGSGIRRMVLVSFFKAEADRKAKETGDLRKGVIYAVEEPETSMHPNYQETIIKSFFSLSKLDDCQVILTTHSPNLAKELPVDSLRFVTRDDCKRPLVKMGESVLPEIIDTLGVLPEVDPRVKVVMCVEGPNDVVAMRSFSRMLHSKYPSIVDIESDPRVMIIPLGGSILKYWVDNKYLKNMGCKEVHIYDNDVKAYQNTIDEVNSRGDGSWGTLTQKYEIENYLHPEVIRDEYGIDIDTNLNDVPKLFGIEYARNQHWDFALGSSKAKDKLNILFQKRMTIGYLEEVDPSGEVKGWFERITSMLS